MRCSEPGHRAVVAIHASRGPGRRAWVVRTHNTIPIMSSMIHDIINAPGE